MIAGMDEGRVKQITGEVLGLRVAKITRPVSGFGPSKWILTTDQGRQLLFKIVEGESKLRRVRQSVDIASQGGVATPPILHGGMLAECSGAGYLIYEFWAGEDSTEVLSAIRGMERSEFFAALGGEVAKLHLLTTTEPFEWRSIVTERLATLVARNRTAGILSFSEIDRAALHLNSLLDGCEHQVRPGLMHGDLYPANFLSCNRTFRAILDFDHAKLYDPYLDFVKLRMWTFTAPADEEDFLRGYHSGGMKLEDFDLRYGTCLGLELLAGLPYWKGNGSTQLLNDYRARFDAWVSA